MKKSSEELSEVILDRISNLPDTLLCHILSYLPTKQAVATSIISKQWEFLWTYLDTLEFEIKIPETLQFEQHVNRALQLHRGLIKRMSFVCYGRECNKYDYVKWIQTAISKKVETLHLRFGDRFHKWPIRLFPSQTLVELKLEHADITNINIPSTPFPNLKKLHLYQPYRKNDSLDRFISGCSILEYFHLDSDAYKFDDSVEACYISSATLKTVSLHSSTSYFDNPKIVLNTPALEVLKIWNPPYLELLVESSMPSLHKVDISINEHELKCLEFLSNVSALCCKVQELVRPRTMFKSNLHAHFNNLTRLEIIDSECGLDLLRILIEKSNNLKAITLHRKVFPKEICGVIWEEPEEVPKCLLSSLQSVSINGYHAYPNQCYEEEEELDLMMKYILANAKVLTSFEIHKSYFTTARDNEFKLHMLQKIAMLPKASVICEISVK